jgi:hypothetical protein
MSGAYQIVGGQIQGSAVKTYGDISALNGAAGTTTSWTYTIRKAGTSTTLDSKASAHTIAHSTNGCGPAGIKYNDITFEIGNPPKEGAAELCVNLNSSSLDPATTQILKNGAVVAQYSYSRSGTTNYSQSNSTSTTVQEGDVITFRTLSGVGGSQTYATTSSTITAVNFTNVGTLEQPIWQAAVPCHTTNIVSPPNPSPTPITAPSPTPTPTVVPSPPSSSPPPAPTQAPAPNQIRGNNAGTSSTTDVYQDVRDALNDAGRDTVAPAASGAFDYGAQHTVVSSNKGVSDLDKSKQQLDASRSRMDAQTAMLKERFSPTKKMGLPQTVAMHPLQWSVTLPKLGTFTINLQGYQTYITWIRNACLLVLYIVFWLATAKGIQKGIA